MAADDEQPLGVLWVGEDKYGRKYLSGEMANGARVIVFRNRRKWRDKQPDYLILPRLRTTKGEVLAAEEAEFEMAEIAAEVLLEKEIEEMAENEEKQDDSIGALWKKTAKSGFEYWSGKIEGVGFVVVFPNRNKKSPRHPDFRVLRSGQRDNQTAPQESQRADDSGGDEIPF